MGIPRVASAYTLRQVSTLPHRKLAEFPPFSAVFSYVCGVAEPTLVHTSYHGTVKIASFFRKKTPTSEKRGGAGMLRVVGAAHHEKGNRYRTGEKTIRKESGELCAAPEMLWTKG